MLKKISIYYLSAFLQGICLILLPGASYAFKSPLGGALTDAQYGILSLPMVGAAITVTLFFKKILRYTNEEKIYYAGALANALSLGFVYATRWAGSDNHAVFFCLFMSNFSLGVGFGLFISVLNLLTVELFPGKRDAALSGLHGFLGIGASLAPVLVRFFHKRGAWMESAFFTLCVLAAILAAAWMLKAARGESRAVRRDVLTQPEAALGVLPLRIKLFLTLVVFYGVVEAVTGNWSAVYLALDKGFSIDTASWSLALFWMFITVGRLGASFLATRLDAKYLYRLAPAIMAGSLLAIVFTRVESRILIFYVTVGIGASAFFPLSIGLSSRGFDRWHESIASLSVAALMLGAGTGSYVTGVLRSAGFINLEQVFLFSAVCSVLIAGGAVVLTAPALSRKFL